MDLVRDLVAARVTTLLLAQHRDSLARTPAYHYLLHWEFEEYSCKMRSLDARGHDPPKGELTDGILDQLAKFERAKRPRGRAGASSRRPERARCWRFTAPCGFRYNEGTNAIFSARL